MHFWLEVLFWRARTPCHVYEIRRLDAPPTNNKDVLFGRRHATASLYEASHTWTVRVILGTVLNQWRRRGFLPRDAKCEFAIFGQREGADLVLWVLGRNQKMLSLYTFHAFLSSILWY